LLSYAMAGRRASEDVDPMNRLTGLAVFVLAVGLSGSATVAAPAPALLGAPPVYLEVKDWVLACDNTRACFAKYDVADDAHAGRGYLSLTRDAGPAGGLVVSLEATEDSAVPDPHTLTLDGQLLPANAAWKVDVTPQTATLEGAPALAFVHAVAGGKVLAYSDGQTRTTVSLSGMTAALLAMDQAQGRLDGVTALARPGPKPASAVPAALSVPTLHAVPAARPLTGAGAFAAQVRTTETSLLRQHDCDADMAHDDQAAALNDQDAIVILGCRQGAYQATVMTFRAPRAAPQKAAQLILPLQPTMKASEIPQDDRGEYVAEDGWDPKTATFIESAKGRGMADCGQSTEWVFDGVQFRVDSFSRLDRCCGGPPGDWPTLYRTTISQAK
jgi:hypothetical protein